MQTNNPLANLKNIHLPEKISIFPLAYGWWILIIVFILLLIITLYFLYKKRKKSIIKKQIINQFRNLVIKSENKELISNISIFLKKLAMNKYPNSNVHILFSNDWLSFLDSKMDSKDFTLGAGKILNNNYKNINIENPKPLIELCEKWIDKIL